MIELVYALIRTKRDFFQKLVKTRRLKENVPTIANRDNTPQNVIEKKKISFRKITNMKGSQKLWVSNM